MLKLLYMIFILTMTVDWQNIKKNYFSLFWTKKMIFYLHHIRIWNCYLMLNSVFIITKKSESMQMIQRMKYFTGYVPKIKFPNRHQNITFSGKKI